MEDSYILFDIPEGDQPKDRAFLENLGHRVMVCNGPEFGKACPILEDGECELASGAHGIVFEFDLDRPEHRAILSKYKKSPPGGVPIMVVVPRAQWGRNAELLKGLRVLPHVPVAGDLDALEALVDAADRVPQEED